MVNLFTWSVLFSSAFSMALSEEEEVVDYTGHQLFRLYPKSEEELEFITSLQRDQNIDVWNVPQQIGLPVLIHLKPNEVEPLKEECRAHNIDYEVAFSDLQGIINAERTLNAPAKADILSRGFDFSIYNRLDRIEDLLKRLARRYKKIANLEVQGVSYENRPIYVMKIGSGAEKPVILMDFGLHAREWISVATGAYLVNRLVTSYKSIPEIKRLIDQYEFNIITVANPDGYDYTWKQDRFWRKTRSVRPNDILARCRGVDANMNFDIDFCRMGGSNDPCNDYFCGDKAFSEAESRAIRDLLLELGDRVKAYFSVQSFSQMWMTPLGYKEDKPSNYAELSRIAVNGVRALTEKHGTNYTFGTRFQRGRQASGSSTDYAYMMQNVGVSYTLELRDTGEYGYLLPTDQILPTSEETFDGIVAAIKALTQSSYCEE